MYTYGDLFSLLLHRFTEKESFEIELLRDFNPLKISVVSINKPKDKQSETVKESQTPKLTPANQDQEAVESIWYQFFDFSRLNDFFTYRLGCKKNDPMCRGPEGGYWTLFGSELRQLTIHLIITLGLHFLGLALIRKKYKLEMNLKNFFIASTSAFLFFLLLAFLLPIRVNY